MTDIRFALAQIDTCVGDLDSNADKVMRYAHLASSNSAQVVVFPEMTLTGYPIEDLALRATFRKAAWNKANWLATELAADGLGDLFVVVGTVGTDRETSKPRNRLVVLHDGVVWAGYDKHFLPNYGVFDEFRIFSPGNKSMVLDVNGARIGVAICEDIWQDGGPVAELAEQHIDLLLTMNGSPYEEGKTDTRLDLAVRRAAEVNAPMVYLNQVGGQDDLVFDGGSFVVDADGTLLERSPMFMEDLSFFDLDTASEHQQVGVIAAKPDPDEEVYTACVLGLKDYMAKNHFKGVCLGLSGGIDSPVASWMIAKRGIALEMVHFFSYPYTSEEAKQKVLTLAKPLPPWCGRLTVHVVPFTAIQEELRRKCPEELFTVLMRRFMMRIAEAVAQRCGAGAIVTGECLGQVASQTMEAMRATTAVTTLPILRPVVGMDKEEIVRIARRINTFETSILPYEDCCTVFTPRHPRLRPVLGELEAAEAALDVEGLVKAAVDGIERVQV